MVKAKRQSAQSMTDKVSKWAEEDDEGWTDRRLFSENTLELARLRGTKDHILWKPFYHSGHFDHANPPYFRVSAEIMGRVMHTFKIG